jgi:hypothetical protein
MFYRQVAFLVLSVFQLNFAFSQHKKHVDGDQIKKYITAISSDEFEGRETGTEGCVKTENYFADKFKTLGLKPIGENNTFYHSYTIPFYKLEGDFELSIAGREYFFGAEEDYNIERRSDGGIAEGKIVFAGYGIHAPEIGRDDYANIDIKDKIVLIKKGAPNDESIKREISGNSISLRKLTSNDESIKFDKYSSDSIKAEYCHKLGAKGILFFENPAQRYSTNQPPARPTGTLAAYNRIKNFPVFKIEFNVLKHVFEKVPLSFQASMKQIEKESASFETDIPAKMSAKVSYDPDKKVRNVLAMIPGTDPELKDEAIVIGGHMDHLGKKYDGTIYNGADDNASGVCITLGIAEAMMKNKLRPKRTIIFACWSGEEKGLLGSDAWVNTPTWDLNKIVVYFNLDMVGLGDGKLNLSGIYFADEVWRFLKENMDTSYANKINPSKGGIGGSDHTPFLKKGIPAFAGMTSGDHPDYHHAEDDAEKINTNILQTTGDFIYRSAELLSNQKQSFISQNRESEIKFRLTSIKNLVPLDLDSYEAALQNKNIAFSLINIGANIKSQSTENNFIDILKLLEEISNKKNNENYRFIDYFSSERNRDAVSLMTALDLSKINYNELYTKALSKYSLKVGFINNDFSHYKSIDEGVRFINKITESGISIILNDLSKDQIAQIINRSKKCLGIITSDINIIDNDLCQSIKSKGHLVIYKIKTTDKTETIIASIHELKDKLNENLICLMPDEFNNESYNKFKEVFFTLDKENTSENLMNRLFGNNFVEFMTKSVTIPPQVRGR